MAEGIYHRKIKKIIYKIASASRNHKKVFKERRIPIPHPTQSLKPLMYLPEITIHTKRGKKYIFEILDSQGKDQNLIIADIIQSYLVENACKVFFIAKNKTEESTVKRLSDIIGARLEENGYYVKELPLVTVYLLEKNLRNEEKLTSTLLEYAKKDKWI